MSPYYLLRSKYLPNVKIRDRHADQTLPPFIVFRAIVIQDLSGNWGTDCLRGCRQKRHTSALAVFGDNSDPSSPIAKLKEVFSRYGLVAILFHSVIWTLTLSTFYLLIVNDVPVEVFAKQRVSHSQIFNFV